jgi:Fe2+ or Zn2+ uptake regulation protein
LRAPPTGHAVCRGCGRILRLALAIDDGPNLEAFLDRRPDGWSAEGVTLTLTGLCPTCQAGGVVPG